MPLLPFDVPPDLAANSALGPSWVDWLHRLPRLVRDVAEEWDLSFDGGPMHGFGSMVVPVRDVEGRRAVLKVSYDGDDEGLHEALALQHWHGDGAVRLFRADPHRRALLLERLHTTDLSHVDDLEACEIVAGLYPNVHLPALPQLRTVTSYVETWLDDLAALPRNGPVPRRLVEQALSLGRDLVADPASTGRIVHGDLHHHNVLAADRAPWLVIDPKPMSGDPHYEPEPMLRNRWEDVLASGDVRGMLRRRLHTLVDVAGLDEDRARDWCIVRLIINAGWAIQDAMVVSRGLDDEDREWITRCITIAKAVQD